MEGVRDDRLRHFLLTALTQLSVRQRQVTLLRYWLDLDLATIARVLGISEGTVKTQLSCARSPSSPRVTCWSATR
jgi:RNA polymerase sigma factor (sigma-70 family)